MFYPDQARYAKLAAAELGSEFVDLDHGNGYLFAVRGNGKEFFSGAGSICAYPINNATSHTIARDKAHTKRVLSHYGLPVIPGRPFFLSPDFSKLRNAGYEVSDAVMYARELGFPIFCKPLMGGRGDFAEVVHDAALLHDYIERAGKRYDAIVIERLMSGAEYRVLVHDGRALYYAAKRHATMRADGTSSVTELLAQVNRKLKGTGISPYTAAAVAELDSNIVPRAGTLVPLAGRSNLSAFGEIDSLDTCVPQALENLAAASCRAIGLRIGAVDIFDISEQRDFSQLVVIEVNGNPGITTLEKAGHIEVAVGLWKSMIRELLEL